MNRAMAIVFGLMISIYNFIGCDYIKDSTGTSTAPGTKVSYMADNVSFNMVYVPALKFPTGVDDKGDTDGDDVTDMPSPATVADDYWIGETEVTYELWQTVRTWALLHDYVFANQGSEGDNGAPGAAPTIAKSEPVTTINWRDAIVWCNAATEWYNAKNGTSYTCAYYSDSSYNSLIIDASDGSYSSSLNSTFGSYDYPYVKFDATGFRLLTNNEWILAARYISDSNNDGDITDAGEYYPGTYPSGSDSPCGVATGGSDIDNDGDVDYPSDVAVVDLTSSADVKSRHPNALGIYDMAGNVWEWCLDWYTPKDTRVIRGGSFSYSQAYMQVGFVTGFYQYNEGGLLGLRIGKNQ